MDKIVGVKGMNDLLPPQSAIWESVEQQVADVFRAYGYAAIRTPIVEPTALFIRGIGEVTDIVEKEMYSFTDALNGEQLTLRPENTAAVVRACIEHNLLYDGPRRLWYLGPMFRHERPQKGRYRQFHQFGVEALGYGQPAVDAEQLLMIWRLWETLGLSVADRPQLQLNSLGDLSERLAHRQALVDYFSAAKDRLDADSQRRLQTNPLRILDSKNPDMAELIAGAPKLSSFLGQASLAHQDAVCQALTVAGVPFQMNDRLVRGLDYYNLTVFEWVTDRLGAQGTVCGGGRYDSLVEQMGGKPAPACGFAIGVERLIALLEEVAPVTPGPGVDVYLAHFGDNSEPAALTAAEILRSQGLRVAMHSGAASIKSQMKKADGSGAWLAAIQGDDERQAGTMVLKALRGPDPSKAVQQTVSLAQAGMVARQMIQEQRTHSGA
ncbi:MAG: putative histidyl-trna synthetase (histidine--trna ligase)(hisrs) protein [Pseudomonadota bacterium]|jgi:histidyl-tRNA synthetase